MMNNVNFLLAVAMGKEAMAVEAKSELGAGTLATMEALVSEITARIAKR